MHYPKISIITPSYNQGLYLEETIKSVLNQNYPNLEYIIIDGGSSDNSVEIIKKYEKYISYWCSEPDKGQSHAINKGLKKATGDIFAYLNSDDLYVDRALFTVAEYFVNNLDVDLVYGDVYLIDSKSNLIKKRYELDFDFKMGCLIGFGIIIPQPATFWRKKVTEKIGYFNESNHYTMDQNYWYRVAKEFKIVHIPKFLAKFRYHESSKTKVHFLMKNSPYFQQAEKDLQLFYNDLTISKFIPYKYSKYFKKIYRLKRIFLKIIRGYYFK